MPRLLSFPTELRAEREGGEGAVGYLAIVVLVAAVIAGVAFSGAPALIAGHTDRAVCGVAGGRCEPGSSRGPVTAPSPASTPLAPASAPPASRSPAPAPRGQAGPGGDGDTNGDTTPHLCKNPLWGRDDDGCIRHPMVKFVRGVGLGVGDAAKGAWDGARTAWCLAHLCGRQRFKDGWSGLKNLFSADGIASVWDGMTEHCRDATVEAGTRCAADWAGMVFGGGGVLKSLFGLRGGDLLARLERGFGPVARALEDLGLPGAVIERLLGDARSNGVQNRLEDIADHAASGRVPGDVAQGALSELDDAMRKGHLDAATYRRLISELADAGDEAAFRTVRARLQSVLAQRALIHGDADGAAGAADAAEAALAEARRRLPGGDPSLAEIEAETVQARRVADLAGQLRAQGRLDAETLGLLRRHAVNLEIVRTGDPGSRSLVVPRSHYDSNGNTLVIRPEGRDAPATAEFLRFAGDVLPERARDRGIHGQRVTDWDGLESWWQGARHHPTDREYQDWAVSALRPRSLSLPERSRQAVGRYLLGSEEYKRINGVLRGTVRSNDHIARDITAMDEAMRLSRVPEDLIVTRLTGAEAFDRPLGGLEGSVQTERGFLSTSTRRIPLLDLRAGRNSANSVAMFLRVPEGTPAVHMSGIPHGGPANSELLLDRGLRYRIDKVVQEDGRWKVFGTILR